MAVVKLSVTATKISNYRQYSISLPRKMVYGYIRVSTDRQTVENQRFEIKRFCKENNLQVDKWISETISGAKSVDKRQLGKLLKGVKSGDIIICSEISRLGRSLFMIMSVLNRCMEIGAKVWTIKDNYRLGDDITSKVLAFAFGLSAEIERKLISQRTKEALARKKSEGVQLKLISQRTKEALARKKSEGVQLGRPKGPGKRILDGKEKQIKAMLAAGVTKVQMSKAYGVHVSTLHEFLTVKKLR